MSIVRKVLALVCILAALWIALAPTSPGIAWAMLRPLLVFIGIAAAAVAEHIDKEDRRALLSPVLSAAPSRAPPFPESLS